MDDSDSDQVEDTHNEGKLFSSERVNPVLTSAAQLAGAEYIDASESESSLLFGQSGLKRKKPSPILHMPPDIYKMREDAEAFKGPLVSRTYDLVSIFRVPEEDLKELFEVPPLGDDADRYIKQAQSATLGFSKDWEKSLKGLDSHLRNMSRLSAFQLLIANATAIQLSDSPDAKAKDGVFAMSTLLADLAARQTAKLMRLSAHTVKLRRENFFAGIPGQHKEKLVESLKKLSVSSDSIFGKKGFTKAVKDAARVVDDERKLGSSLKSVGASSSGSRRRSDGKKRSSSRYHPYASSASRGSSRGRGTRANLTSAKQQSSKKSARSQSKTRGGRGKGRPWNKRL